MKYGFYNAGQITLLNTILVSQTVGITVTNSFGQKGSAMLDGVLWTGNGANTSGGSGIYVKGSSLNLWHNTFAGNSGGDGSGILVTYEGWAWSPCSNVALTNSILVSHTVGITVTTGNTTTINGALWSHNGANTGAPAFAPDGYHIMAGSAAIDVGVATSVSTDIDNEPRFGIPDLGADEYWAPGTLKRVYLPLAVTQQ